MSSLYFWCGTCFGSDVEGSCFGSDVEGSCFGSDVEGSCFGSEVEVLNKLEVVCWFSTEVVVRVVVCSGIEVFWFSFSVGMEVLWIIILVFAPVVSLIIDVAIWIKEVVFNSDSFSIFVDSFISVEGKTFSLVETDWVELLEVTLVVSLIEEVVSIIGLVDSLLIRVVSILEVLNSISKALVVSLKVSVVVWALTYSCTLV